MTSPGAATSVRARVPRNLVCVVSRCWPVAAEQVVGHDPERVGVADVERVVAGGNGDGLPAALTAAEPLQPDVAAVGDGGLDEGGACQP